MCEAWPVHPLLRALEPEDRRRLRRCAIPSFTPPMLATLSKRVFSDPAWIYEAKLDGQRSLLWKRGKTIRLITRNRKDRTSHYPDLVEAVTRAGAPSMIADGEIVAFRGEVTSFSQLQGRMQNARPSPTQVAAVPVFYYLFDVVWFDGYDLSSLRARKVCDEDFQHFDLILAMDRDNFALLEEQCPPEHRSKLKRLTEFACRHDSPVVPDPYYSGADGFERVLDLIEDACEGLVAYLKRG